MWCHVCSYCALKPALKSLVTVISTASEIRQHTFISYHLFAVFPSHSLFYGKLTIELAHKALDGLWKKSN